LGFKPNPFGDHYAKVVTSKRQALDIVRDLTRLEVKWVKIRKLNRAKSIP
jgi:hypothetical protein